MMLYVFLGGARLHQRLAWLVYIKQTGGMNSSFTSYKCLLRGSDVPRTLFGLLWLLFLHLGDELGPLG